MYPPQKTIGDRPDYRQIPNDEYAAEQSTFHPDSSRWARRYFIAILVSILCLTGFVFVRDITGHINQEKPRSFDWLPCGNTSMEARVNNCVFDPMLISWVPEACYIADPADEYDVADFKWFADAKRTQPIDSEMIRTGDYSEVYTDGSHHDQHCIYTWRKLSIAIERRLPMLDTKSADFHHSTHCAKGVRGIVHDALNKVDMYKGTYSAVPLAFTGCVPLFL